jgi:hypothetical protein
MAYRALCDLAFSCSRRTSLEWLSSARCCRSNVRYAFAGRPVYLSGPRVRAANGSLRAKVCTAPPGSGPRSRGTGIGPPPSRHQHGSLGDTSVEPRMGPAPGGTTAALLQPTVACNAFACHAGAGPPAPRATFARCALRSTYPVPPAFASSVLAHPSERQQGAESVRPLWAGNGLSFLFQRNAREDQGFR